MTVENVVVVCQNKLLINVSMFDYVITLIDYCNEQYGQQI